MRRGGEQESRSPATISVSCVGPRTESYYSVAVSTLAPWHLSTLWPPGSLALLLAKLLANQQEIVVGPGHLELQLLQAQLGFAKVNRIGRADGDP